MRGVGGLYYLMKMLFRRDCLYIYTDGSSIPKPRRGGMGVRYVILDENEIEYRIDLDLPGNNGAINNQMELKAVIEGIKQSRHQVINQSFSRMEIRTDSRYVADNKDLAIYSWSKNGWLNKNSRPVENAELWKELWLRSLKYITQRIG